MLWSIGIHFVVNWNTFFVKSIGFTFFVNVKWGISAFYAKSVANRENMRFLRPSWGKNVLRGLSNKCLMRGTFRAICVFKLKASLAYWEPENTKSPKTRFYEFGVFSHFFGCAKNAVFGTPKTPISGFSRKTTKIMFFMIFIFHKLWYFVKNIKFKIEFYKFFDFIKTIFRILPKHSFQIWKQCFPDKYDFLILFENPIYPRK